jgi:hypothetical protein
MNASIYNIVDAKYSHPGEIPTVNSPGWISVYDGESNHITIHLSNWRQAALLARAAINATLELLKLEANTIERFDA